MLTPTPAPWIVRGATFALWALAAGSAAFWGLKVTGSPRSLAVPLPSARQVALADPVSIAKLLGSSPVAGTAAPVASLASRFQLLGVVAGVRSGEGAAVISVDGKPPRSYRVGSPLDESYKLKSVHGREAVIAVQRDGQPVATLAVPQAKLPENRPPPMAGIPPQPGLFATPAAPVITPAAPVVTPPPAFVPILPNAPATPPQAPGRRHAATDEPT
jgi:general secretion pathway protein C